jgi:hypothetical protein
MIRQCAWCHRVVDIHGHYGIVAQRKLSNATHGICPGCKELVRAEFDRSRSVAEVQAA